MIPGLPPLFRFCARPGISILLLTGLAGPALAIEPDQQPLNEKIRPNTSVDEIARQINQQPQWRILAAEPTVEDEKLLYRFKLLNKQRGRVEVITVDPDKPELLNQLD